MLVHAQPDAAHPRSGSSLSVKQLTDHDDAFVRSHVIIWLDLDIVSGFGCQPNHFSYTFLRQSRSGLQRQGLTGILYKMRVAVNLPSE